MRLIKNALVAASATLTAAMIALAATGCSGSPATQQAAQPATPEPMTQSETITGDVSVDGSSTVFPITEAMAEEFGAINHVRITVGISGTGGGFKRFCAGETDISNASRIITAEEIARCEANGISFVEVPVAFDGLTVVVNSDNDWVDYLTVEELHHIFKPEGHAVMWSDVREGFPDLEIDVYAPGADSGTFDYFTEAVNEAGGAHRTDGTTFSENDNTLVIGVSNNLNSIAYFGFSYYYNNQETLKAIAIINDQGEAIFPSAATINDGTYNPLSRPLLVYVSESSLNNRAVEAFMEYYLSEGTTLISSPGVGYVEMPDDLYEIALSRIADRVTGSALAGSSHDISLYEAFSEGQQ